MNDTKQALEAVVGLVGKATPEPLTVADDSRVVTDVVTETYRSEVAWCPEPDDAAAIAAAVNLIRTHGPALIAALEDARRWRKLRELSGADGAKLDQLADEQIDAMAAGGDS